MTRFLMVIGLLWWLSPLGLAAFNDFEEAPHRYWETPPQDAATQLHRRMAAGEVFLPGGEALVYLKAYLRELRVPEASQTLVFSKTAFQRQLVHAGNPRAVYFNQDVAVGYIPGGRIEVAAVDPVLGGIFYIFDAPTAEGELPKFERPARCLGCHAGSFTNFLPGLMTHSVHTQADGRVLDSAPAHFSGHAAPLADRWGGWIVTGEMPGVSHQGNRIAQRTPTGIVSEPMGDPAAKFSADLFLHGARSDGSALLALDHMIGAVNRLMEANYRVRSVLHDHGMSGDPDKSIWSGEVLETARDQAVLLSRHLLFEDETPLPSVGLQPDPAFAAATRDGAPADAHGRSLHDLSLQGRLYQYRCSPMIGSTAFRGLPRPLRRLVWEHIRDATRAQSQHPSATRLSPDERAAIRSILLATESEFVEVVHSENQDGNR
ncbi:MAG: hypothetical protein ACKV19_02285 [Verrucomicrobiales bacterium]